MEPTRATPPGPTLAELERRLTHRFAHHARGVVTAVARPSAVLLLLFDHDGAPHTLLTKRAAGLPHHPGQISLPGGRWEPDDADLVATALRETHEEVGIPPGAVRALGMLDDVHVWVSGFVLTPVVGVTDEPLTIDVNPGEIDRAMLVPVHEILAHDAVLPAHAGRRELRYPLDHEDVWGATAVVLRSFARAVAGDGER